MGDDPLKDAPAADAAQTDAAHAPQDRIVYGIDTPQATLVRGEALITFAGWALSTSRRPVGLRVLIGRLAERAVPFEVPRPDVLEVLHLPDADPLCGFGFNIDMEEHPGGVRVELEFNDGKSVVRTPPYTLEYTGLRRAHYQEVWDKLTESEDEAKLVVAGFTDEDKFHDEAEKTKRILLETVGVRPDDVVLEVGAGVGRVGSVLAPLCKEWIGADVSANMLGHLERRLQGFPNVRTVLLNGYDLSPFAAESIDLVYCTVVFMHLDEWDRYLYVREAWRVLRPGGRLYADNFSLLGDKGWELFEELAMGFHPHHRPAHISKSSTPQELYAYFQRAGFIDIRQVEDDEWVRTYAIKPNGAGSPGPT